MARIVEAAWRSEDAWGLFVWLSAVTGARRGEVIALQWEDVDLERGEIRLDENYVRSSDGMILKDTKTHQMRRLSIDAATVVLLRKHKEDCATRLNMLGLEIEDKTWVFSAKLDFSQPREPSAVTRRYSRLVAKLKIKTMLKELRHYSATELLTAGVDLRTVSGRLGHGDGATTLRYYTAWVGAADKAAATTIAGLTPLPPAIAQQVLAGADVAEVRADTPAPPRVAVNRSIRAVPSLPGSGETPRVSTRGS
jgi:integrase